MKRATLIVLLGGFAFAGTAWAAARKSERLKEATVDVTGIWNVTVEFGGGTGHPVFTFKQDGGKLTGRYAGAFGAADVTGTIRGDEIQFSVTIAGQSVHEIYAGTVDRDTMKGKFTLVGMGEGTFTGTRQSGK